MNQNHHILRLWQWLLAVCMVCGLSGCRETIEHLFSESIEAGDAVNFTSSMQGNAMGFTRGAEVRQAITEDYLFTIDMMADETTKVATGRYRTTTDAIGSLEAVDTLYWPSTTTAYGFKATAGSDELSAEQSTKVQWLLQDRLEGQAEAGTERYLTAKNWKKYNVEAGLDTDDNYKKVPLFMEHTRSLITVILKAGEGVSPKALYYSAAQKDITTRIYSYAEGEEPLAVNPLVSGIWADNDSTTRYDAIVEPHDYATTNDLITKITLSGQNYSFYAANDVTNDAANYKLDAGKHLIITVTLGRESRQVRMTAYIEDWTEEVTTTICDDYGNAGEPIKIKNRQELIDFLTDDTKNKAGNVALVTANIDLGEWTSDYDLRCTLNLGGWTLSSNHRFLNNLQEAATLQNGAIQIDGSVDAAVAAENKGVIEDIRVTASGTTALATQAGVVITNSGSISKCRSALRVLGGATGYVGGIAAQSLSMDTQKAIIDGCTVTSSVKGGNYGGGIVGQANGSVTNNTFAYGITLLQNKETHKNIVAQQAAGDVLTASGNAWPTIDTDLGMTNATAEADRYTGIIDSEAELSLSATGAYNAAAHRYRLAQDITVSKTVGSVDYDLDGNGKQITTSAQIFQTITGQVHDFMVCLTGSLIATPLENATDAIAPLAFEVHGADAEIRNVKVELAANTYIQAANPAGLVVWAWDDATITGCEVKADIRSEIGNYTGTQVRKYAGGIVSTVSRATVTQCVFHSISSTLTGPASSSVVYYGGIVGGIEKKDGTSETPELTITDCTCFYVLPRDDYHGGILGYAIYSHDDATSKDCQGNWWPADSKGVGNAFSSDEAVIGKRNGVTPVEH